MRRLAPPLAVLLVGVALLAAPAFAPSEPDDPVTPGDGHADEFGLFGGLVGLLRAFVGSLYAAVGLVAVADGFRRNRAPSFRRSCGLALAATVLATALAVADPWTESQLGGAAEMWLWFLPFALAFAVGVRGRGRHDRLAASAPVAAVAASLVGSVAGGLLGADWALALFAVGVSGGLAIALVGGPLYALGRWLSE